MENLTELQERLDEATRAAAEAQQAVAAREATARAPHEEVLRSAAAELTRTTALNGELVARVSALDARTREVEAALARAERRGRLWSMSGNAARRTCLAALVGAYVTGVVLLHVAHDTFTVTFALLAGLPLSMFVAWLLGVER